MPFGETIFAYCFASFALLLTHGVMPSRNLFIKFSHFRSEVVNTEHRFGLLWETFANIVSKYEHTRPLTLGRQRLRSHNSQAQSIVSIARTTFCFRCPRHPFIVLGWQNAGTFNLLRALYPMHTHDSSKLTFKNCPRFAGEWQH